MMIQGFFLGLSSSSVCLTTCAPILLPFRIGEQHSLRRSSSLVGLFPGGRLVGYLLFAVLAWTIGAIALGATAEVVVSGPSYLLVAVLLGWFGFQPTRGRCAGETMAGAPGRITSDSRMFPPVLGFLTGLSLCPPFIAAMNTAMGEAQLLESLVLFLFFFLGTSLVIVPTILLRARARYRQFEVGGRLTVAYLLAAVMVIGSAIGNEAEAATRHVINADDNGSGSLRQTIIDAVADDTIVFDGDYTIVLASELAIGKNLTIDGTGRTVIVSGNHATRVFNVTAGTVTIKTVTIADGTVQTNDCGGINEKCGGGLILQNNASISVTIQDCTVSGNSASRAGSGIYVSQGTLNATGCTFAGNSGSFWGGGIENENGIVNVTNCTFTGNSAAKGGGVDNNAGPVNVSNSTFSGNSASAGGGIYRGSATVTVTNSIVANSTSGGNCSGTITGSGNLSNDATCGGAFTNSSSILFGPVGNYGGNTLTVPLLPGSAAIDAGSSCPSTDQRGVSRVGTCDIGAFESRGFSLAKTGGDDQSTLVTTSFADPLTLSVTSGFGEPVDGGRITFQVPATGPSASISGNPAAITGGTAGGNTTANAIAGAYTVNAGATGAVSVGFSLTNTCLSSPVTVTTDANDGAGSLRQAIDRVCPGGTITFDGDRTILLAGELAIDKDLTIDGSGHWVVVSGNHATRVFNVTAGQVTLKNLTIADGNVRTHDCSGSRNCGGGMMIHTGDGIVVTVLNCTFLGNEAILDDISATFGGGINQETGNLIVTNCTFSGNTADFGGGISRTGGTMTMTNCTFSGNVAFAAGGLDNRGGTATVNDTIIANSVSGTNGNCYNGATLNGANNLSDDSSCPGFTTSSQIQLGSLGDNGGDTPTFPILVGSAAIDAGSDTTCAAVDQRGVPRPQDEHCDIGAYELEEGVTLTTPASSPNPSQFGQSVRFTATVTAVYLVPTGTVQFSLDGIPLGGPVPLLDGVAEITVATMEAGLHTMIASYGGDSACLPSTSDGLTHVVCGASVVDNAYDNGPGSLRQAIVESCSGTVITFATDLTIALGSELVLDKHVTIDGRGHSVIISGDTNSDGYGDTRVFSVKAGVTAVLNHVTVVKGYPGYYKNGGGLSNSGTVQITDVVFSGNAGTAGGGIYNEGTLTLANVVLDGNSGYAGGGLFNAGTAMLAHVSITGNDASGGGGIANYSGELTVTDGIIAGNQAGSSGGGIVNAGTMTVTNCTISANQSSFDGGSGIINELGYLTLTNCTVSDNSSTTGGSLVNHDSLTFRNTIIANDIGGVDCVNYGTILSSLNNLVEDGTCSDGAVEFVTGDPLLGPLSDNGGDTLTHALLAGSPAINAGNDATCPISDQRGAARPTGAHCDIGAYEFQATLPPLPPVADGKLAGSPAAFTKRTSIPDLIDVTFDAATCSTSRAVILHGTIGDFAGYAGCAQSIAGDSGFATISMAGQGDVWFNIVWTDGFTAGHPGFGNDGTTDAVRNWNAAGFCGLTSDNHTDAICN